MEYTIDVKAVTFGDIIAFDNKKFTLGDEKIVLDISDDGKYMAVRSGDDIIVHDFETFDILYRILVVGKNSTIRFSSGLLLVYHRKKIKIFYDAMHWQTFETKYKIKTAYIYEDTLITESLEHIVMFTKSEGIGKIFSKDQSISTFYDGYFYFSDTNLFTTRCHITTPEKIEVYSSTTIPHKHIVGVFKSKNILGWFSEQHIFYMKHNKRKTIEVSKEPREFQVQMIGFNKILIGSQREKQWVTLESTSNPKITKFNTKITGCKYVSMNNFWTEPPRDISKD